MTAARRTTAEPRAAEPKPVAALKGVWVVRETKTVLWQRCQVEFRAGSVLDPPNYGGEAGIQELKNAGLQLDPA